MTSSPRGVLVLADDAPSWKWDPVEQARAACGGGAVAVQLRAKLATDRAALETARRIRALTREAGLSLWINDRFDLALAADADGVHLGQDDLPPDAIPASARARLAVGRSTHSLAQVERALGERVDYVAFGPVFGTHSKASPYSARGLDALAAVVARCAPTPVVAIGGIDAANAGDVAATGAAGAAVISCVAAAPDPAAAVRALADAFAGAFAAGRPG